MGKSWIFPSAIAPIKNVSATVPEASPPKHVAQTVRETGTLPQNKHVQH